MELLVRTLVGVLRNDLLWPHTLGQRRRPAVEFLLRHDQVLAAGTDGALGHAQHPTHWARHTGHLHRGGPACLNSFPRSLTGLRASC